MRTGDQHQIYDYSAIVDRAPLPWPDGARVALWVVPNIEHYEFGTRDGGIDVPQMSRRDYANRVGVWRVMEVLDNYGIKGTVALNSAVCRHYPRVIEACLERGWELMGHGITNSQLQLGLSAEEERELIFGAVSEIRNASGQAVRGWLGPGLHETPRTLDLLKEAGVEYVCDFVNDDQPYRFRSGLYSIPYSNELNDMRLIREPVSGLSDFGLMLRNAFDTLYREGGRVICIALHPFVLGTASRIALLDEVLGYICGNSDVWRATGGEIIDWYKGLSGA
ncbi:MAG TPA: polysaccharide deacetylase family protein [Chloroflexota bacterium]|nr:polysaccharide deacetylase family protein [Chloroflexota bacterium]